MPRGGPGGHPLTCIIGDGTWYMVHSTYGLHLNPNNYGNLGNNVGSQIPEYHGHCTSAGTEVLASTTAHNSRPPSKVRPYGPGLRPSRRHGSGKES